MRAVLGLAVVFGIVSVGVAADPKGTTKSEFDKFTGTWKIVSMMKDGKKFPAKLTENIRLVVRGNKFQMKDGEKVIQEEMEWTLDATKTPKTFTTPLTSGEDKGKTVYGIYKISGNTLHYCEVTGTDPTQRPKEFSARAGSGRRLSVWKRVKE